jgi:sugar/nucleoside kinase (ribokinase family)/sugar phosphate isomerase/epimerase
LIKPDSGEVSAVVSGGSNLYGWGRWVKSSDKNEGDILTDGQIQDIVSSHSLLVLQCEIPSHVNVRLAKAARKMNMPVIVDVGGEDRRMERELLECCDYLIPNETELERLAKSYQEDGDQMLNDDERGYGITQQQVEEIQAQIGNTLHLQSIIKSVQILQKKGARNMLVTLGSQGSILMKKQHPSILYQPPCPLPSGCTVVDETGAGDCYRAGFAVALLEHCGHSLASDDDVDDVILQQCMKFASAAGAYAVTRQGAVPSIPSRRKVEELMAEAEVLAIPRGGSSDGDDDGNFPFLFGSRINSMKDRLDLVDPSALPLATPHDYLRRQATIRGLGCVDFNFPQHFGSYWTPQEAKKALDEVNLVAGAVCLRYPSKFARGAMNHPDPDMRREAIGITKQAAEAARVLGCNEVVVWSAYDGYDYPFQVSYQDKWDELVQAFQECCDAFPDIKWSLEFKPTDENTRFFTVPSTGAAMLLVKEIDRPNMGLTLDMGHMLMSGENPGQSISMVGEKLFGIQLNDGYTRLAAEDGMMFGSIHPSIALEAVYQLRRIKFSGHLYFDTFPQRTDPVKEAEYNIRRVKEFWRAVTKMDSDEIERVAKEHDAIGALELVNEALRR